MRDKKFGTALSLDSYLKSRMVIAHTQGFTFARTLPRTPELPEVTVGLGALYLDDYFRENQVTAVPSPLSGNSEYSLVAAVEQKRAELSGFPNWQERLLLDLGYARSLLPDAATSWDAPRDFKLFDVIPEGEKAFLLKEHGFHKLAMMVAYGYTHDISNELRTLDQLRGDSNYGDLLRLMNMGVPLDDLPLALQLPEPMVRELYGQGSGNRVGT